MNFLKTPLHKKHLELNAKMMPFANFDMPIQYSSVKEECLAVRNKCGVFDVSHMGEFVVSGPDAQTFVDYLVTNDFQGADNDKAVYSPLCRENGTIIDDLIAYKLGREEVLICVNASNIKKDWDWINSQTEGFNVQLKNESEDTSLLAIQGPESEKVLKELSLLPERDFPYYSVFRDDMGRTIARTGYTGEDGFEVFCSNEEVELIWDKLLASGVTPCGLASRDVLRLEVCYPLYGHELSDEITPLDAGLKWTVKNSKENFIGKKALSEYSPKHRLVKLSLDKGIPREGYKIFNSQNEEIGTVTSGTHSVSLEKGICIGLIKRDKWPKDKIFHIQVRKNTYPANYHAKAFITGGHK